MKYNIEYLNLKYALIIAFMHNANKDIFDISYIYERANLKIQVVLMKGSVLSDELKNRIIEDLRMFTIEIVEIYLTREQFNENKGNWEPKYYSWLENVLFSKAEVL